MVKEGGTLRHKLQGEPTWLTEDWKNEAVEILREGERLIRKTAGNMSDGIMLADLTGRLTYVNRACEQLFGYKARELLGSYASTLFTGRGSKVREDVWDVMKEIVENGGVDASDMCAITKTGKRIPVRYAASGIRNEDDDLKNLIIIIREITTDERTAEALSEKDEYFKALIENSLDGIAILDENLVIRYESPSSERIVGYRPEEMVGRGALEFLHPDDVPSARKSFKELGERPVQAVPAGVRFLHKNGSWRVMEGIAHNLLNDSVVNGIVVNYRDITERTLAEEALKEREERFRVLIENSLDNISILNVDGTIRFQSPSVERVLGYAVEEHIGKNCLDFVHPDDMPDVSHIFNELVENSGSAECIEVRALHKDGSWRTLEVVVRNLVGDPVVGGLLANFRDITERKLSEEARVEHAAALARAEELQLSRQRMVAVQESVRRDIAQQIHGSVQNRLIILLHRLNELERGAESSEMAAELTDLRLKLGELIDSHVRPISHRLYPSILRRGLVAALQSLADQFEATLDVDMQLDEELHRQERANPRWILEQVRLAAYRIAEETLTNATKSANARKVTISLRLFSGERLRLAVRDNGQGFDVASVRSGSGILMMQDYAEIAGGECVVNSVPGDGAEVIAILPLSGPGAECPERSEPSV